MKIRQAITISVIFLMALFAGNATAAVPGWYIGLEGGASFLNPSRDTLSLAGGLDSRTNYDTGWLGGLTLGYQFDNGWRLELEPSYSSNDIDTITSSGGSPTDVDGKITNISAMVNAWYDFNADGAWHPYIGAGVGAARLKYQQGSPNSVSGTDTEIAYQVGVGFAFDFTKRLTADIGYRYFATPHPHFKLAGLKYKTTYEQNVALLSLRYLFYSPALKDSDGDGVPDYKDQCPDTPSGVTVDSHGCPLDADNDGVPDYQDKCPNTPDGVQVDASGCPLDADNDGVPDYQDKCPNTPAGVKVDATGCPLVTDSDSDGVPDDIDQCPNTPPGVQVMTNGCAAGQNLVLKGVKFKFNKTVLTAHATGILDKVVTTLKDSPGFNVDIDGYTDSIGSASYNRTLSQQRADTVKQYLASHGISADRLTATGHGAQHPIAPNSNPDGSDNPTGRAKNRRVELTPVKTDS